MDIYITGGIKRGSLSIGKKIKRNTVRINGTDTLVGRRKATYLGVEVTRKLDAGQQVTKGMRIAKQTALRLFYVIRGESSLPARTKANIIDAVITFQMIYGLEAYNEVPKTHMKKLEDFRNRLLRRAAGAPYYVRNVDVLEALKKKTLQEMIENRRKGMVKSLKTSDEEAVRKIGERVSRYHEGKPEEVRRQEERIDEDRRQEERIDEDERRRRRWANRRGRGFWWVIH